MRFIFCWNIATVEPIKIAGIAISISTVPKGITSNANVTPKMVKTKRKSTYIATFVAVAERKALTAEGA